jgi:bifunctional DNA-binding transcriptional regulator/antitoxin component of YhaV-PrlF toxin-antitoxin module
MNEVISVTKKGQATLPKKLRTKYHIKDKVICEENWKRCIENSGC